MVGVWEERGDIENADQLVSLVFCRRMQTLLVGVRHLFDSAAVEPAKPLVRAQFELYLAIRYLVYGAKDPVTADTETYHRSRETRARYYHVATLRNAVYQRVALLDGAWGLDPPTGEEREAIEQEVQDRVDELRRRFPRRQQRFGPLRCLRQSNQHRGYFDRKEWFTFGFRRDPPTSVRSLADRLAEKDVYHLTYEHLSGLVHPTGMSHDVNHQGDQLRVYSPYMVEGFDLLAHWALAWASKGLLFLSRAHAPDAVPLAGMVIQRHVQPAFDQLDHDVPEGYLGAP